MKIKKSSMSPVPLHSNITRSTHSRLPSCSTVTKERDFDSSSSLIASCFPDITKIHSHFRTVLRRASQVQMIIDFRLNCL
uniref:Uncharacterized protein n=1 Tax=Anguilla anguilla TaxID=7936 RepID=A0A0E9WVZ4_ANGAN